MPGRRCTSQMRFGATTPLGEWQKCWGMCVICGQPLDRFSGTKAFKEKESLKQKEEEEEIPVELETKARQALFACHMMGEVNKSHLIDEYVYLPKDDDLREVLSLFPDEAKRKPVEAEEYQKAYTQCMDVCPSNYVIACRRCNVSMTKTGPQAVVSIGSSEDTRDVPWRQLVDAAGRKGSKRNDRPLKALQRVALFFRWDSRWVTKPAQRVLHDGHLWRCVVQLGYWAQNPELFRHRAVAVLYVARLLHDDESTDGTLRCALDFLDWHVHVFRPFYVSTYPPNTFFGHSCVDLQRRFPATTEKPAAWCAFARQVQQEALQRLQRTPAHVTHSTVIHGSNLLRATVHDEQTLLLLLCRLFGSRKEAVARYLRFMHYNIEGSNLRLLAQLEELRRRLEEAVYLRRIPWKRH